MAENKKTLKAANKFAKSSEFKKVHGARLVGELQTMLQEFESGISSVKTKIEELEKTTIQRAHNSAVDKKSLSIQRDVQTMDGTHTHTIAKHKKLLKAAESFKKGKNFRAASQTEDGKESIQKFEQEILNLKEGLAQMQEKSAMGTKREELLEKMEEFIANSTNLLDVQDVEQQTENLSAGREIASSRDFKKLKQTQKSQELQSKIAEFEHTMEIVGPQVDAKARSTYIDKQTGILQAQIQEIQKCGADVLEIDTSEQSDPEETVSTKKTVTPEERLSKNTTALSKVRTYINGPMFEHMKENYREEQDLREYITELEESYEALKVETKSLEMTIASKIAGQEKEIDLSIKLDSMLDAMQTSMKEIEEFPAEKYEERAALATDSFTSAQKALDRVNEEKGSLPSLELDQKINDLQESVNSLKEIDSSARFGKYVHDLRTLESSLEYEADAKTSQVLSPKEALESLRKMKEGELHKDASRVVRTNNSEGTAKIQYIKRAEDSLRDKLVALEDRATFMSNFVKLEEHFTVLKEEYDSITQEASSEGGNPEKRLELYAKLKQLQETEGYKYIQENLPSLEQKQSIYNTKGKHTSGLQADIKLLKSASKLQEHISTSVDKISSREIQDLKDKVDSLIGKSKAALSLSNYNLGEFIHLGLLDQASGEITEFMEESGFKSASKTAAKVDKQLADSIETLSEHLDLLKETVVVLPHKTHLDHVKTTMENVMERTLENNNVPEISKTRRELQEFLDGEDFQEMKDLDSPSMKKELDDFQKAKDEFLETSGHHLRITEMNFYTTSMHSMRYRIHPQHKNESFLINLMNEASEYIDKNSSSIEDSGKHDEIQLLAEVSLEMEELKNSGIGKKALRGCNDVVEGYARQTRNSLESIVREYETDGKLNVPKMQAEIKKIDRLVEEGKQYVDPIRGNAEFPAVSALEETLEALKSLKKDIGIYKEAKKVADFTSDKKFEKATVTAKKDMLERMEKFAKSDGFKSASPFAKDNFTRRCDVLTQKMGSDTKLSESAIAEFNQFKQEVAAQAAEVEATIRGPQTRRRGAEQMEKQSRKTDESIKKAEKFTSRDKYEKLKTMASTDVFRDSESGAQLVKNMKTLENSVEAAKIESVANKVCKEIDAEVSKLSSLSRMVLPGVAAGTKEKAKKLLEKIDKVHKSEKFQDLLSQVKDHDRVLGKLGKLETAKQAVREELLPDEVVPVHDIAAGEGIERLETATRTLDFEMKKSPDTDHEHTSYSDLKEKMDTVKENIGFTEENMSELQQYSILGSAVEGAMEGFKECASKFEDVMLDKLVAEQTATLQGLTRECNNLLKKENVNVHDINTINMVLRRCTRASDSAEYKDLSKHSDSIVALKTLQTEFQTAVENLKQTQEGLKLEQNLKIKQAEEVTKLKQKIDTVVEAFKTYNATTTPESGKAAMSAYHSLEDDKKGDIIKSVGKEYEGKLGFIDAIADLAIGTIEHQLETMEQQLTEKSRPLTDNLHKAAQKLEATRDKKEKGYKQARSDFVKLLKHSGGKETIIKEKNASHDSEINEKLEFVLQVERKCMLESGVKLVSRKGHGMKDLDLSILPKKRKGRDIKGLDPTQSLPARLPSEPVTTTVTDDLETRSLDAATESAAAALNKDTHTYAEEVQPPLSKTSLTDNYHALLLNNNYQAIESMIAAGEDKAADTDSVGEESSIKEEVKKLSDIIKDGKGCVAHNVPKGEENTSKSPPKDNDKAGENRGRSDSTTSSL